MRKLPNPKDPVIDLCRWWCNGKPIGAERIQCYLDCRDALGKLVSQPSAPQPGGACPPEQQCSLPGLCCPEGTRCKNNVCYPVPPVGSCDTSKDCFAGQVCRAGTCQSAGKLSARPGAPQPTFTPRPSCPPGQFAPCEGLKDPFSNKDTCTKWGACQPMPVSTRPPVRGPQLARAAMAVGRQPNGLPENCWFSTTLDGDPTICCKEGGKVVCSHQPKPEKPPAGPTIIRGGMPQPPPGQPTPRPMAQPIPRPSAPRPSGAPRPPTRSPQLARAAMAVGNPTAAMPSGTSRSNFCTACKACGGVCLVHPEGGTVCSGVDPSSSCWLDAVEILTAGKKPQPARPPTRPAALSPQPSAPRPPRPPTRGPQVTRAALAVGRQPNPVDCGPCAPYPKELVPGGGVMPMPSPKPPTVPVPAPKPPAIPQPVPVPPHPGKFLSPVPVPQPPGKYLSPVPVPQPPGKYISPVPVPQPPGKYLSPVPVPPKGLHPVDKKYYLDPHDVTPPPPPPPGKGPGDFTARPGEPPPPPTGGPGDFTARPGSPPPPPPGSFTARPRLPPPPPRGASGSFTARPSLPPPQPNPYQSAHMATRRRVNAGYRYGCAPGPAPVSGDPELDWLRNSACCG